MKKHKILAIAAFSTVGVIALGAVLKKRIETTKTPSPERTWAMVEEGETEEVVVGVDELMKYSAPPKGEACVQGVVSGKSDERQLFTLIDTAEFKRCKVITCAQLSLPVRWDGPMPKLEQCVDVDGEVRELDGKRVLVARSVHAMEERTKASL